MASLKFLKGSAEGYAAIEQKDANSFYVVENRNDENVVTFYSLYLGDKLIADGVSKSDITAIEAKIQELEGKIGDDVSAQLKALKTEILGNVADGDVKTIAELNDKIDAVSNAAKTYSIAKLSTEEVTKLGANVFEAYQLIDEDNAIVGDTIKIYKDSSLQSVALVSEDGDKNVGQFLKFVYLLADGSDKTVYINVSEFLAESEFGDGLEVIDGVVKVNIGETTEENKNFLTFEADGDGNKAIAVRSIDVDSTVTTDRILVAGGPLDSTALRNILPKDESGNAYIESGTDVQSLLLSLFTKVEWPTPTVTEGKIDTTIAAPSFTLKNGSTDATNKTYEVGTVLTLSDATLSEVSSTTTARTCSEFTYGYATAVEGSITKTKTISIDATNVTVNDDNYTMSRDFTNFANADDSATSSTKASDVTLAGADCVLQEGECKVKVTVNGPKGECTFAEMPSYFVASNVGTLSDEHKSPTKEANTVKEDTTPSNSKEIKVNGRYKYFMGNSTAQVVSNLNSESIRGLGVTGWTTVNGTTTIKDANTIWESNGNSIVIACPNKYALNTVTDSMGNDYKSLFSEIGTVDVVTGSINTTYNVYIYPITSGTVMKLKGITLK